ncbi:helix-turn-helix domain-containing protein [bacterium]|nr:helix-turn-helix domain-containing protein [bacterium]
MPSTQHTRLWVSQPHSQFIFTIRSRMPMAYRRQIALEIFRAIKPVIRNIYEAYLVHSDAHWMTFLHAQKRILTTKKATQKSKNQGLHLRLRRLELGLTLRELAAVSKVDYSQLSLIERGYVIPRPRTYYKLKRVLFPKNSQPNPTKGEERKKERAPTSSGVRSS